MGQMKKFMDIYEARPNPVAQRRALARRMSKMAKSPSVKAKKARTKLKMRNPAKLKLLARKKTIQKFRQKYFPRYDNMSIQQKVKVDQQKTQELIKTITCKYIHQNEIFISSTLELWPCCFLFDSTKWNKHGINEKYADFGVGWNSLVDKSINEVLTNPYFNSILIESWNPVHGKHLPRCLYTCGKNAAYHNEIKNYA